MEPLGNNLIRNLTGGTVRPATTPARSKEQPRRRDERRSPRAALNYIPDAETLTQLIAQARTALSKGIFWDRGAIINIVL